MKDAKLSRRFAALWSAFDYAFWRLLKAMPSMLLIVVTTFVLLRLASGNATDAMLGDTREADPALVAQLSAQFGLDQSLLTQFHRYVVRLVQFDFGWSFAHERPVAEVLHERLGTTLLLASGALFLAFTLGSALGTLAARRAGSFLDHAVKAFGFVLHGMPSYFLGLMLIAVFALELHWLPEGGLETPTQPSTGVAHALDVGWHLLMPMMTLTLIYLSHYARRMRASVLQVGRHDHVRTARAKGVAGVRLTRDHIVRNALLPIVAPLALQFSMMLSAAVVVESLFSLPGLGQLAVESVVRRELHTLMAVIFLCALLVIGVRFWIDVLHAALDRRIKHR